METKRKVSCFLSLSHEQHWPWGRQRGCIGHFTGAARIEKQNNCRSGIHCFDYFNIVALVGNAILCFIPYGNPKLRSSTTMLIVALACTDLLTTATVMPLTIDAVINSRRRFSETRQTWAKSHISKYWEFFNSFFVQDNFACFIEWLNSALVKTDQRKSSSAQIGYINQQSLWIEIIDYWKLMLTGKSVFSEKHFQY